MGFKWNMLELVLFFSFFSYVYEFLELYIIFKAI